MPRVGFAWPHLICLLHGWRVAFAHVRVGVLAEQAEVHAQAQARQHSALVMLQWLMKCRDVIANMEIAARLREHA